MSSPAPHDDGGVSAAVKAAAAAGSPSKAASKPPSSSSSGGVLRRVAKTSFAYKTDLETKDEQRSHPSGIVHATRASSSKEEHCFVWMDNVDDAISTKAMVDHLGESGYKPSGMKFVPFSTKENWTARYPHAVPHVECGAGGAMAGTVPVAEGGSKKRKRASKKSLKKAKPPPQFLPSGRLPDAERDELHRDIYQYLSWLHAEVAGMETTPVGRRKVQAAGVSVPALRGLLGKMEGTFRGLRPEGVPGGPQLGGAGVPGTALLAGNAAVGALPPGLAEGGPDGMGALLDMDGVPVPVPQPQFQPQPPHPAPIALPAAELPYLERALSDDLRRRVAHARPALSDGGGPSKPGRAKEAPWRREDFDALFDKLVAFRAAEGHASPPIKHPEVGKWVSELRLRKKTLRAKGMEWEDEEEEGMEVKAESETADGAVAAGEGANVEAATDAGVKPPPAPKPKPNVRLTKSRVARLDAIDFQWTLLNPRKTWEEHFADLRQFLLREGRPPTNKEGGLGNWLKTQRKLYSKRDADFLERRAARFDEIGVPLRTRHYSAQSWEDRFQQLVEFGRVNRHFNVPNPVPNGEDPPEINTETAEAVRFYKFVKRLHTEYRALQRGGGVGNFLTPDRVEQLRSIGFDFATKPEKEVPDLDWTTRISQLESFQSEMGHMRVDPNYDKYSNLGGWAVEVSERHRAWQEGREYLTPETVDRFNQLNALGFGFDVFRTRRGERTWDESFNLLLQYRHETGSCRVPHHYKADFRLGSWVAVQRKEYKALCEGKKSKMTDEKIRRLESVGFEWVATRGHND